MTRESTSTANPGARERLHDRGVEALSDADLVALLLGTGGQGEPVARLAERVLRELGGLHQLGRSSAGQLARIKGLGTGKSARLSAAVELGRRAVTRPLPRGGRIASSEDVYRAFGPFLAHRQHEELWAVALDARQRMLCQVQLARGGLSACPASLGDVFRPLIREGASGLIVIHNHPSGAPDPSPEDLAFTDRVAQAGELLGIFLLDHVIVAADGYYSCLDAGSYRGPLEAEHRSRGPRAGSSKVTPRAAGGVS
jgi:DNA repair protein RadC